MCEIEPFLVQPGSRYTLYIYIDWKLYYLYCAVGLFVCSVAIWLCAPYNLRDFLKEYSCALSCYYYYYYYYHHYIACNDHPLRSGDVITCLVEQVSRSHYKPRWENFFVTNHIFNTSTLGSMMTSVSQFNKLRLG